ncbi:MAG: hypothetical protein Q8Q73_17760 [Stagnimonas sp.]|nr:hypothetical protein [Stagnimonas sp.]
MSEKSDDIKQLFSHLGLNPGDYQEIRNAPSAGATMTEAPRRWSLLQAISAPSSVASVASAARVMPSLAPAVAPAVVPSAPPPPTPSQWAEILPGLATPSSPPPPAPEPPLTAAADGLKSLFQSVREPLPAAPAAAAPSSQPSPSSLTGEQAADLLYRELRGGAQTLAARRPPPPVTPPWAGYDPEQETRHAPTPVTPVRVAAPHQPPPLPAAPSPAPAPAAAAAPTRLVLPLATEPMPELPRPVAPPRPALAPTPAPAVASAPRSPPSAPPPFRAEAMPAATGLQAAFRRLSEPEPPRAAASGRLRLNYRLPHSNGGGGSKDERLGDVLKRISGHNGETR